MRLAVYLGLSLIIGASLLASAVGAQDCTPYTIQFNREAAVFIRAKRTFKQTGRKEDLTGSGFVVSKSGFVLTADHLVTKPDDVDTIVITGALRSREATPSSLDLVAEDKNADIALLKFTDSSPQYAAVLLGDPQTVEEGTQLCSVEFPTTLEYFHGRGTLSGKGAPHGYWYTDMPSNPGDSGAPVFRSSGGVVAMKISGFEHYQNLNLLVPLNLAGPLLLKVPDKKDATIQATWNSTPPTVTYPQPPFLCKCISSESSDRNSYPMVNGYHTAPQGTVGKISNHCNSDVSVLLVKETVPNFPVPALTVAAPGRSYFVADLSPGQTVNAEISQSIAGTAFCLSCPSESRVQAQAPQIPQGPLNCVSDARLFPNVSPPGIPYICPAQGPAGSPCSCGGHAGFNYVGNPMPYP
ncbi:MAG TPA: serine protease [Candidatus Dormibacteraeota bacterium]|nr:serine protease [Candidatus Dormibacteraeota bacterium]